MFVSIFIKNIAIIKQAELHFTKGMSVISGESGSGKSILLQALNFVLGKTNNRNLLNTNKDPGTVIAEFLTSDQPEIKELLNTSGISYEQDRLFIRRNLTETHSNCFINDVKVSISFVKKIANLLIEIHGQNDHIKDISNQIKILDKFGNIKTYNLKQAFIEWQNKLKALNITKHELEKHNAEKTYLNHVFQELTELDLKANEELLLKEKRKQIIDQQKIQKILSTFVEQISDGAIKTINKMHTLINSNNTQSLKPISDFLEKAAIELDEAVRMADSKLFNDFQNNINNDIEKIEERLFKIHDIARKYNKTVEELFDYYTYIEDSLKKLSDQTNILKTLEKECQILKENYQKIAIEISKKRQEAAKSLEKRILKELTDIKMQHTKIKIEINNLPDNSWNESGCDQVLFKAAINPGSDLNILSEIASGGELSRFILAIKTISCSVPTIVFDEIDSGIGGSVAEAVGIKLQNLSNKSQVIVITHQPQVASKGCIHFKIEKIHQKHDTTSIVKLLDKNDRKEEIARMLSGLDISDEARLAAEKLLTN